MSSAPTIITSQIPGEVPIIFDTGASCSILTDFTGHIEQCNTESLGGITQVNTIMESLSGLTHVKIKVYGEVVVAWNIKEMDHEGVHLTLAYGSPLSFPLQTSNNLLFMLISKAFKTKTKKDPSPCHIALTDCAANILAFLATATLAYF